MDLKAPLETRWVGEGEAQGEGGVGERPRGGWVGVGEAQGEGCVEGMGEEEAHGEGWL